MPFMSPLSRWLVLPRATGRLRRAADPVCGFDVLVAAVAAAEVQERMKHSHWKPPTSPFLCMRLQPRRRL
jgi:hypothetical protein